MGWCICMSLEYSTTTSSHVLEYESRCFAINKDENCRWLFAFVWYILNTRAYFTRGTFLQYRFTIITTQINQSFTFLLLVVLAKNSVRSSRRCCTLFDPLCGIIRSSQIFCWRITRIYNVWNLGNFFGSVEITFEIIVFCSIL